MHRKDDEPTKRSPRKIRELQDITARKQMEEALRESEERFRLMADTAPVMIWMSGPDSLCTFFNKPWSDFTGRSLEQEQGTGWTEGVHPDDLQRCNDTYLSAFNARRNFQTEYRLRRADGEYRWVFDTGVPRFTPQGVFAGYIGSCFDVTERRKAESALQEAGQKLRSIVEHSTNLFYVHNTEHVLTYVSPQSRQFFDCEPEEAMVRWTELITDNPANKAAIEATQRAIDTGEEQPPYQIECIGKKGRKIWVEVNETPLTENGKTMAIVGSLTDITDRKRAEDALRKSEKKFLTVFHAVPALLAITTPAEGKYIDVNETCVRILGYQREEMIGRTSLELGIWESQADRDRAIQALDKRAAVRDIEVNLRGKTGESFVGLLSAEFIDIDGEQYILSMINDITARKRAEDALRESEDKFSRAFQAVPSLLVIATLDEGRFIEVNEAFERTTGNRRTDVIGRTSMDIRLWKDPDDRAGIIRMLCEGRKVRDREISFVAKDGTVFIGLYSAEIIEINGEKCLLSLVNDITARKRAEEEIEKLNTDLAARAVELENANRELEAFSYSTSHDLRKPLTVINGYCQIIQELCGARLDEQCRQYLQEIHDGTLRMNELIDALLKFSCLTRSELHRETVDLSGIAKTVASELMLTEPGRRVTFRLAEEITVNGDAQLLRVVLENLLGNAWKYTATREEAVIEFGVTDIGEKPAWFVRDNGTGFAMADAAKLFLPFQRLPGADAFQGHGIGLATVQRIIHRHGGRIWAEGEPGKGATFWFTL